ncbi:MAG: GntR family transcriptional regulator [Pseudomonadota bacterium]|nr:GntR family transcriptional regulator [Pseudomonadota bacterium]
MAGRGSDRERRGGRRVLPRGSRPRPSREGIERLPARDRAYHELKFRILEGRLAPGTTLLETEVADLLALSRTPVREALIRLEEEGLVEVKPRHGVTVKAQSLEDIREILDVFSALEVKAAGLLATRGLAAADAAKLSDMLDAMEDHTRSGEIEPWSELDDVFHSEIVALCGNRRLQLTLQQYWGQQYRARVAIVRLRPPPLQSDAEHRAILHAIRDGDERLAMWLHRQHRDRADAALIRLLATQIDVSVAP